MGTTGASTRRQHDGFEFAGFTLDLDRAALFKDSVDLGLRPQVIDVLRYLVERSGSLVTKEELLASIWGDKAVTDDSLTHCIIEIRKALEDADRRIIRTVPRRGFVCVVSSRDPPASYSLPDAFVRRIWRR
jgi:DNA-binding winged helix-turn-helix (wHTH) protein